MKTILYILLIGIVLFAAPIIFAHLYFKNKIKNGELTEEQLRKMIEDKKEQKRLKKLAKQSSSSYPEPIRKALGSWF